MFILPKNEYYQLPPRQEKKVFLKCLNSIQGKFLLDKLLHVHIILYLEKIFNISLKLKLSMSFTNYRTFKGWQPVRENSVFISIYISLVKFFTYYSRTRIKAYFLHIGIYFEKYTFSFTLLGTRSTSP